MNWGRVGAGFSPECDAAGRGASGREEGRVRARIPPRYSWGASPRSCAPPPPPGARGAPKQGAEDTVAAGRRRHSLEAQQTNTFILRHFQCRLWVGVAGDETGPELRSPAPRPSASPPARAAAPRLPGP